MAEWLGHLMAGWPTWLIGIVALAIFIIGVTIIWWTEAAMWGNTAILNRSKKNGKK